jgi:probable O-glycosylation ligase (exosortase A-associated)
MVGSAVPFWALMAFTFILLIAPQESFPALRPLRIALLAGVVAIATYLFDRLIHRQPMTILPRELWITACLAGWAVLTVPLSYWPGGSLSFLLNLYFKALAIFWLLSNIVNTLPRLRLIAWGLSVMALPLASSGVRQYLSGNFFTVGVVNRIIGYGAPLTENPNDLALTLNLILPLSVALFLSNRNAIVRIVLLPLIVLDVIAVIVTFSRGGFLTLATIAVMYLWKLRKRPERGWAVAALLLMVASIPFLPADYVTRLGTIADVQSDPTGSSQARWSDTIAAVNVVVENPIIGVGVGMNMLALNEERGPLWRGVHNVYLEYAAELGLPGLTLFLMLLAGCVKSVVLVQRRSSGVPSLREVFYLAEGIQISLIAFAVAALFHPVAYLFYFYYIAGLAVALKAAVGDRKRTAGWDQGHQGLYSNEPVRRLHTVPHGPA